MTDIIIDVENLGKQYIKQKAVDNVSFQIKKGMICGLIGPNGAGKTTIMKMLGGLVLPTNGKIKIFDCNTEKQLSQARKKMSFMIETPYAKESMTARENLEKQRLQKGIKDKSCIDKVLEIVNLADTGKKPVKSFSLGMRQRLGIANALLTNPEIMVLDEPVNGLDPQGIVEIRELLLKLNKEQNITIIISSHLLNELSLICTDYIFINKGNIVKTQSSAQLKDSCKQYYKINTNNNSLAEKILREKLSISQIEVENDGSIKIYEMLDNLVEISECLYKNGVIPTELNIREINLEQYYMDMIGGVKSE